MSCFLAVVFLKCSLKTTVSLKIARKVIGEIGWSAQQPAVIPGYKQGNGRSSERRLAVANVTVPLKTRLVIENAVRKIVLTWNGLNGKTATVPKPVKKAAIAIFATGHE